jgi:hypothetical protein
MKMFRNVSIVLALVISSIITAGCHAQQIPPAPVITAPVVTSSAYVQLNMSAPTTAASYVDQPATGSFCYFVQMLDGAGVSGASNTFCATTTAALKHIALSWNAPAGYSCQNTCSFVVSRAPAVLTPVGVPVLGAPNVTAELNLNVIRLRGSLGE